MTRLAALSVSVSVVAFVATASADTRSPDEPPPPPIICDLQQGRRVAPTRETIDADQQRLHGCICKFASNAAACDRLIRAEGAAVRLDDHAAGLVHHVTHGATRKGSRVVDFGLQYDPELAQLTGSMAFTKILTGVRSRIGVLNDALIRHSAGADHDDAAESDAVLHKVAGRFIEDMSSVLGWAADACESLAPNIATPETRAAALRDVLICAMRLERDSLYDGREELSRIPVYASWPGAICGEHGAGRVIPWTTIKGHSHTFCVDSDPSDPALLFSVNPIDRRVPERLSRFAMRLKARMGSWRVERIVVSSCTLVRLETGPNVRTLAPGSALQLSDVSDHSRATACDVNRIDFGDKAGNHQSLVLRDGPRVPFFEALRHYTTLTTGKEWREARQQLKLEPGGVERFYRDLESHLVERPAGLSEREFFQLRTGALVRNALADSDFNVYEPFYNDVHQNHFHIEADDARSDAETAIAPLFETVAASPIEPCRDPAAATRPR